ncbi:helix-turn-helix domain-containing protein [Flavobacterium cerinum]|uniref:XRE family transcriptional regulator n=1 Tax=Flavobacterium cerinum TaxID=2502784 RepID=A0A444GLV7_9FLAO|nr:helix-turn-helix transcriptional regulator [Flavobacterium cerinum]RWW91962.1 XRE family transcriptional regulator [Flavobacterium cerinum]
MSTATQNHIGRKISRIRELRDMKQEVLATALGVSQQTISNIENSEIIEEETLEKIAEVLGVSAKAIQNFNEETVLNIISNSFTSNDSSTINAINVQPTFNPIDKLIETYGEKEKLYERLLQAEKEKIAYLEKLIK